MRALEAAPGGGQAVPDVALVAAPEPGAGRWGRGGPVVVGALGGGEAEGGG